MKAKVTVLNVELELEAKDDKALWQQVAFYQSLPTTCPIDDTPTRFAFRSPQGNDYYEIANTNPHYYITFHIGQNKEGGSLFASGEWAWWDYINKVEIPLAKWSTLTDAGKQLRQQILGGAAPKPPAVQAPATRPVAQATPAATQDKAVSRELVAARKTLHALGQTYYGSIDEDWNEVRKTAVAALNKRYGTNYTSSNDLPLEDVGKWIVQLEKKTRTQIQELAELAFADDIDQAIADLVSAQTDGQTSELNLVGGVALTHVLKAVEKALEALDN